MNTLTQISKISQTGYFDCVKSDVSTPVFLSQLQFEYSEKIVISSGANAAKIFGNPYPNSNLDDRRFNNKTKQYSFIVRESLFWLGLKQSTSNRGVTTPAAPLAT